MFGDKEGRQEMNEMIHPTVVAKAAKQPYSVKRAEIEYFMRRGERKKEKAKRKYPEITPEQSRQMEKTFYGAYACITKGVEYVEDFIELVEGMGYRIDGLKRKVNHFEVAFEDYRRSAETMANMSHEKFISDFESFGAMVDEMLSTDSENWNWELKAKFYETIINDTKRENERLKRELEDVKGGKE